jgi:P27 family predicted phage terminase small subunit
MAILTKRTRQPGAPRAPRHLSGEAKRIWEGVTDEYGIVDIAGQSILAAGLEAFDRMREAQAAIRKDGPTIRDRFEQIQVHPATRIERDSRAAWLSALKALNLDLEPLQDRAGRPNGR